MPVERGFIGYPNEHTEYSVHVSFDAESKGGDIRIAWRMIHVSGDQSWSEAPSLSGCNLSREGILALANFASQHIAIGAEVAANIEAIFDQFDKSLAS